MIPVVEMLRVSTQGQAGEDRAGLPAQHAANVRTCSVFNLMTVETVEIVESGVEVASSPQMARVLETITSGRARGIVLAEYSRLFRPDRWTDLVVLQTLTDYGAQIYLPSGPIDLQSEPGFVQATVNNLLAGMERKRIRDRMMRGKEEHRKRGAHMGGGIGLPFGLAWSKDAGWSYTADIERVRELFRAFLAGDHNYEQLGQRLGLARTTVRFVLQNPVYTGWRVYDKKRDLTIEGKIPGRRDRRKVAREPHEVIRVRLPLEPIITVEDFDVVQEIVAGIHRRQVRTDHADAFAYRGHLVCDCGRVLYSNANKYPDGAHRFTYLCPSRVRARRMGQAPCPTGFMRRDLLEPVIDGELVEHLTDRRFLVGAIADYLESQSASWRAGQPDDERIAAQFAEINARRARVLDLFVDGTITRAERDARLSPLDRDLAAIERLLTSPRQAPTAHTAKELAVTVATSFSRWRTLGRGTKLGILDRLGAEIRLGRYEVRSLSMNVVNHPTQSDAVGTRPTFLYLPFRVA